MESNMKNMSNKLKLLILLISLVLLGVLIIVTIGIGSVSISVKEIIDTFLGHGNEINESIIMDMRLPRIIIAVFVGAGLSISGALLQSIMNNPLADPGITGVSSGASLLAITVMLYFSNLHGILPLMAFLGAMLACIMVFILSWDKGLNPMRVILSGVAVNAVFVGATSLLSILNSDKIQGILLWINGSIAYKGWTEVKYLVPYSIIGIIFALLCAKGANLLALGDDVATNLGVNVTKTRFLVA
ncbi:iron ABC transporter permease, partial [Clostridium haemolyticum]|uniref:FecCD family ABC transporter permease n=1 Tax=Clostridium haemolyticum TaxID=84025 RepID=UPI0009C8A984